MELVNSMQIPSKIFFLSVCCNEKYISLEMFSFRQVILKFILFTSAKKYKLTIAQTCIFLNAYANKIN